MTVSRAERSESVPHIDRERGNPPGALWWASCASPWDGSPYGPFSTSCSLGFATGRDPETGVVDRFGDAAWINGGSPTEGFLENGLNRRWFFDDLYSSLAGLWWVDWINMLSMLLIGVALMLGVFTRLAALGGIVWMALFYTSSALWPENNPVIDDHVIYAIALAGIAAVGAGRFLGLGRWWERKGLAARHPMLR
jgi:thiosulfate dehydrogenase [quinone] large subunit